MKFVVIIALFFTLLQWGVSLGLAPSVVKPFNKQHEDLLFWISFNTFLIISAIANLKAKND